MASELSQERKNMAAMFTKLVCLHALFPLCICPFVVCTPLPSIPDSIVTGRYVKAFFLSHTARLNLATIFLVRFFNTTLEGNNLMMAIAEHVKVGYTYSGVLKPGCLENKDP